MNAFGIDGPLQKYGTMIYDVIITNTLFIVLSALSLGVMCGPALAAGYACVHASTVCAQSGAMKLFWATIKARWKVSLVLFLIMIILLGLEALNIYIVLMNNLGGVWMMSLYGFFLLEIIFVFTYAFPLAAVTKMKFKDIIKWSFILCHRHLGTTLLASVCNVFGAAIVFMVFALKALGLSILIFFIFGLIMTINSHLIIKRILTSGKYPAIELADRLQAQEGGC